MPTTTSQLKIEGFSSIQSDSKSAATINFISYLFNFSEIKFKLEKEDAYIYLPIWIITVSIIFFGIYSSPIIEFSNLSADYLISGYQN